METLKTMHYFAVAYRPLIALAFGVLTWVLVRFHGHTRKTATLAGAGVAFLAMIV